MELRSSQSCCFAGFGSLGCGLEGLRLQRQGFGVLSFSGSVYLGFRV